MLRKLGDDIKTKSYAAEASRYVTVNEALASKVRNAVAKENKKAAGAIRSVVQSRQTLIIRATSRTASSELFTVREAILKAARDSGISSVRFTA